MITESVIGILGAGTMGTGIAQTAASCGHDVLLYDSYPDRLGSAKHELRTILQRQVDKDRMTQEAVDGIMEKIEFTEDITAFGNCELVIEAVTEELQTKLDLFRRVEGIVSRDCILATNTSSLAIASLSSALKWPSRFLGIHFFNPAPLMPLVEIIPGIASHSDAIEEARDLIDNWGKITVMAKDTPGFIVNRIATPYYGEALRMVEEGVADVPTVDWAMREIGGFRMGPFELMDLIGNDVSFTVNETLFREFFYDPRFRPSITQKRMVQAGYLGKKSGKGFYEYGEEAENPDPETDPELGQKILDRILVMLINEACDAVFMGIASAEDVELAMTNGVNYPKGLLKWGDEIGLKEVLDKISALQVKYREDRYRPNPLLKEKVHREETFF